jgi:hypothetical protein
MFNNREKCINQAFRGTVRSQVIRSTRRTTASNVPYDEFKTNTGAPSGRIGKAKMCTALACSLCSDPVGFAIEAALNLDADASPGVCRHARPGDNSGLRQPEFL